MWSAAFLATGVGLLVSISAKHRRIAHSCRPAHRGNCEPRGLFTVWIPLCGGCSGRLRGARAIVLPGTVGSHGTPSLGGDPVCGFSRGALAPPAVRRRFPRRRLRCDRVSGVAGYIRRPQPASVLRDRLVWIHRCVLLGHLCGDLASSSRRPLSWSPLETPRHDPGQSRHGAGDAGHQQALPRLGASHLGSNPSRRPADRNRHRGPVLAVARIGRPTTRIHAEADFRLRSRIARRAQHGRGRGATARSRTGPAGIEKPTPYEPGGGESGGGGASGRF